MKSLISLGLLTALPFFLIPQPSFAKQTWLKCVSQTLDGKPATGETQLIKLDDTKERYEIEGGYLGRSIAQGKAVFYKSLIQFSFIEKINILTIMNTFKIDRSSLKFLHTSLISGELLSETAETTGICKVIPAPSAKKNKI